MGGPQAEVTGRNHARLPVTGIGLFISLVVLERLCSAAGRAAAFDIHCTTIYRPRVSNEHLHYLPTVIVIVILIIIGIPSPTHSFTIGLNPSFSANPPYRTLSFFSFRFCNSDPWVTVTEELTQR